MYDLIAFLFHFSIIYSVRKLFTGFAIAAFIAWKLTVAKAMKTTINATKANSHQLMVMR
jgi:hypothetical protein